MNSILLSLNNNANFYNNYLAYVNVYTAPSGNYMYGFPYNLKNTTGGITGELINNNTIRFSPTIIDSNYNDYFDSNGNPKVWLSSNLYQQQDSDLLHVFQFQGNINNNTLHTMYQNNYIVKPFIKAYNETFNLIAVAENSDNSSFSGNFNLNLDLTNLYDVRHLQWGVEMFGYPVWNSNKGNQGSVSINTYVLSTNYKVNNSNYTNKDLNTIFAPYTSGSTASSTNYKVNNSNYTNKDLNTIFAPYISGTKASSTNMKVDTQDLADIFQKL